MRPTGRTAVGVRGIRLREGDYVIGAGSSSEGSEVLSITENGLGKRTDLEEFRFQSRGGYGVTAHRLTEKTGAVAAVRLITPGDEILVITDDGTMIRLATDNISRVSRSSQGVWVMRPTAGSHIIDFEKVEREDLTKESEDGTAGPDEQET